MRTAGQRLRSLPRYVVLLPLAAVFVFPFYWMVVLSLSTLDRVYQLPPNFIPLWNFENFATAWSMAPWGRYFANTVFMALTTTLLVLITSTLAGYAFAQISFPGKAAMFIAILAIYMVPPEVTLIPNFIILKDLGWLNTYQAQIIPFGATVFGIFLMRQFFLTMPRELWDAAQLDGCGHATYLWRVAAPLARAPLAAVALFHFVGSWNAFLWPLIMANDDAVRPIQVGLRAFTGEASTDPVLLAAGSLMTTLPMLVMFLVFQRQLVGGFATTGIRG